MTTPPSAKRHAAGRASGAKPEWANGLRQLYDAVVDEPLPDSFRDLLAQLDRAGAAPPPADGADGSGEAAER